jgi:ATP-dependent Lhr-like helicase
VRRGRGLDAVLDAVEKLQGAPLAASLLESEILPARVEGYLRGDLDRLAASGEVVWVGLEPLGERDGRVALYLAEALPRLLPPAPPAGPPAVGREAAILDHLGARGASFFGDLHASCGGGYEQQTVDALWSLAWRGLVTNDTFQVLRAFTAGPAARGDRARRPARPGERYRSRLATPQAGGGRWTLVEARRAQGGEPPTPTGWSAATAQQLLQRHGIVSRGVAAWEGLPGGFSAVYDVLRHLEESGRIRRGYFVAGVGALQFAQPAVLDLLRSLRVPPETAEVAVLSATDPASPYGAALEWPPARSEAARRPARAAGAQVVLVDGALGAWVAKGGRQILAWLPEEEPDRTRVGEAVAGAVADLARAAQVRQEGALVEEIDGAAPAGHALAPFLVAAGFLPGAQGFQLSRRGTPATLLPAGPGAV